DAGSVLVDVGLAVAAATFVTVRLPSLRKWFGASAAIATFLVVGYLASKAGATRISDFLWGEQLVVLSAMGTFVASGVRPMSRPIDFAARKLNSRTVE